MHEHDKSDSPPGTDVAVIAMTGRFPGANDLETFWRNLREGVESITVFTHEELAAAGVPREMIEHPNHVPARGIISDVEMFDAAFFGYSPRDALAMDPQQRLFLECCWQALEVAGYDPQRYRGLVGVYGGATTSSYGAYAAASGAVDRAALGLGNDLTYLTTRVSYKLDLRGPSCPVQTACSTSLVAVHLACQGLLNAECDIALAGGVSIRVPQTMGYIYQDGGIVSPDGHCRSFDARAKGTVFSHGLGVVALKRLEDAIADGDAIRAVIKGSAINNDGSRKASFTAPGVTGQTEVIADALASAEVDPDTVGYVEAHGSATALGDSIELQALLKAFGPPNGAPGGCAVGSVKANIGHLDAAAGIAGLIKTVLALEHRQLPPNPRFERLNPDIRLEGTRFYVADRLADWQQRGDAPRRAGVSSFGFGGTNAHVVVEEAPAPEPSAPSRGRQLLVLSAQSREALDAAGANLAAHLREHPSIPLADVAHTLQVGRRAFPHRRIAVAGTAEHAAAVLERVDPRRVFSGHHDAGERPVVFMFTGQGAQHPGMGAGLYRGETRFREIVDECCALLRPHLGLDLQSVMFPEGEHGDESAARLTRTALAQPALFVVEYALARLWMAWGVIPEACIGHSIGELVAACLSGVFTLADTLELVAKRGQLMERMPEGAMTAVPLPEAQVRALIGDGLWLAAVNAPALSVISGAGAAVERLEGELRARGVEARRLQTSHAFHSGMMEEAVAPFVDAVSRARLSAPRIPWVSNPTGTWISDAQARDPEYWGRQIREPVLFARGLAEIAAGGPRALLEVGPGNTLAGLARQQIPEGRGADYPVLPSLPHPRDASDAQETVLTSLGRLWLAGVSVDWAGLHAGERRRRVPLPSYPFQRQRYWVEPGVRPAKPPAAARASSEGRAADVADWFYVPAWVQATQAAPLGPPDPAALEGHWLVFTSGADGGDELVARLEQIGLRPVAVTTGPAFARTAERRYAIDPARGDDYRRLLDELAEAGSSPSRIAHLWAAGPPGPEEAPGFSSSDVALGFASLMHLSRALAAAERREGARLTVVTRGAHELHGREPLLPGRATVQGLCCVLPQEHPDLTCRSIDFEVGAPLPVETLLRELASAADEPALAYRGRQRWVPGFRRLPLSEAPALPARIRPGGVYLITGGLGEIGLEMGSCLAALGAKPVLVGRSGLPPEPEWERLAAGREPVAARIQRVRQIRERGGEVLVLKADAASRDEMSEAFAETERRFGSIDGVIHAAGLVSGDAFRTIAETAAETVEQQFRAKVSGLCVLSELLRERRPDFCMLVSSLSVVLGGIRYASYASANAFMDAFALRENRGSRFPWITVNWDAWLRARDAARLQAAGKQPTGLVMTPSEGVEAFRRILSADVGPRVLVSVGDLDARIERWVRMAALREDPEPVASRSRFPRPSLQTEYVAPEGEVERGVAEIWAELLGLERVGANDNFFELGGDSFLGIQVIAGVKKRFGAGLSAVSLYEGPTVRALSGIVTAAAAPPAAPVFEGSRSRGARRRERKLQREPRSEQQVS